VNNPLTALLDGLRVAETHWQLLFGILLVVTLGHLLLYGTLKAIFGNRFSAEEYYSLSLSGWILPASLISLLWYFCGILFNPALGTFIAMIVVVISVLLLFVRTKSIKPAFSKATVLILSLLTLLFIIFRLAFVSRAVFPLYFDSAQHYLHVKRLLANLELSNGATVLPWSLPNYHLGFHFLSAFVSSITHGQITDVMLVLGQIILALMPFSVFLFIRHETGSNSAGMFAIIVTALGWYMPAHAVDWGKYPALASIGLLPFVLSLAYLVIKYKNILSSRQYWIMNSILLAGIVISVFLHSRSLILFGIVALTYVVTYFWQKISRSPQLLVLSLIMACVIFEIVFIQTKGILGPLFDPYASSKGLLITLAVLFLSFFAYRSYPHWVISCIVSIGLLLASLFIPLKDLIPGYANMTVLDRPFVEMILYLPLTLLGGFGLAGLAEKLQSKKIELGQIQISANTYIGALFCGLVVINALFTYDLYPSDCCIIVSTDDVTAIEWMDKNLPMDARVLTASNDLNVLPTDAFQGSANGDAGAWINPITNRTSVPMPFYTDFSQRSTLDTLCQLQVGYVYVGGTGWTFDDSGMPVQPGGYQILLALPKVKVYQVTGCD